MPNPNPKNQFKKGNRGRKPGIPNKTTQAIRDAFQFLVEDNLDNLQVWLEKVAEKNPKDAIELTMKLSEYVIPKLARKEIVGADGKDLFKNIKFDFGTDDNKGLHTPPETEGDN